MPLIAQILVSTFKVVRKGGGMGVEGGMPLDPPRNFLLFFSLAIPGSDPACPTLLQVPQHLHEKLQSMMTQTYCKLCSLVLNAPLQAAQHYQGKNHAKRVRLFVSSNGNITQGKPAPAVVVEAKVAPAPEAASETAPKTEAGGEGGKKEGTDGVTVVDVS